MAGRRDGLILMAQDRYWTEFLVRRPRLVSMIIPNGVALPPVRKREEPAVRAYAQAAGMRTDASLTIGSVGRLVPARRPELYIPVFAEIVSAGCEVRFLIAGEGPERDRIAVLAEEQGISDRLYLPGLALDPSLPRALVDLYITVNVGPITGLNGLEAAMVGLPVIAIQLLDDYVTGPDDWIWSSADTSCVAQEAIRLLGNGDARTALAARQQDYVRSHHGIAAMAAAYEELYRAAGAAA